MTALNKQALLVPERKRHDWSQSVMRDCDFCSQWSLTVKHENGGCICASCCDAEYTEELKSALESAIDRAESAEKRIAELERSETQLINERDDAESALNDAYKAVMGQAPEWSNWFSFADAIDEIELACRLWRNQTADVIQFRQRIAELEANKGKPVMFIDGDISASDAEKLAAVIREWDAEPAPIVPEEMEVREVVVKQFDDFQIVHYGGSEDYAKGYIDCQNNYNKALTAAGIGVKGECQGGACE